MNQAILSNPRNCYERYAVAVNPSNKTLYTYMGKLQPNLGNATFSGAGEIAPIINDPSYRTIGIGSRIFLGGTDGYVIGNGTQHNPGAGFGTLSVQGNLKEMSPDFIRGATMTKYGCTLFVGVGVPIPVLNSAIAKSTSVSDEDIVTSVLDYSVPSRSRPSLRDVTYAELKTGSIEIDGYEIPTAPISSFRVAERIADQLKRRISVGEFQITEPVKTLSSTVACNSMNQREYQSNSPKQTRVFVPDSQLVYRDQARCINCALCVSYCSSKVFTRDENWNVSDNPDLCVGCGECSDICPQRAIAVRS
jgi:uncharacterized protein (DUF39 family)/Pyruvate/2-oxoacid:ferredoxin oxidoreductase delta subunit